MPDPREIKLRPARPDDADGIAGVQLDCWRDAYVGLLPDRVLIDMKRARAALNWARTVRRGEDRELFYVAEWQGRVVGFCNGGPRRDDLPLSGAESGETSEIYVLYVDPSFQGIGVGSALMLRVIRRLARRGYGAVALTVLKGNRSGESFYARVGGEAGPAMACSVLGANVEETVWYWPDLRLLLDRLEGAVG